MKHAQRQDEIFDIVNERDEVIGQRTRGDVHRLGLKHRAVHVLVVNAHGEIFLQKRSMQKDTFPGAWDSSASGHLDTGEDYDACAVRELWEELGLKPNVRRNACSKYRLAKRQVRNLSGFTDWKLKARLPCIRRR